MKTHLITTLILIGLLALCVGMAMSYYVLMGVMGTVILVFVYSMIFTGVSRNMVDKKIPKK
jgi:CHASE2 domain-containing sensor protein